jgi:hypothetical protein
MTKCGLNTKFLLLQNRPDFCNFPLSKIKLNGIIIQSSVSYISKALSCVIIRIFALIKLQSGVLYFQALISFGWSRTLDKLCGEQNFASLCVHLI